MAASPVHATLGLLMTSSLFSLAVAGKFWHISDFHYDPEVVALRRSCLNITQQKIGRWGSEYCDAKKDLVFSTIDAMKHIEPNPDFILWTGDSAPHYLNGTRGTEEEIVAINREISEALDAAFPDTVILPSLGNHDYVPDNQLPAEENVIYRNISDVWSKLGWFDTRIGDPDSVKTYGYYTSRLDSGLIVMVLNTNYYYSGNRVFKDEPEDPGNQFAELEKLLTQARQNGSKVLLTAHVPYGFGQKGDYFFSYKGYSETFASIVKKYADVIAGSFFGHEHVGTFKVIFSDDNRPISVAYLATSVTPWRYKPDAPYHNPGINLVEYDKTSFKILDCTQYYMDFRSANAGNTAEWKQLQKFTSAYGVVDMTPKSMHEAAKKVRLGDKFTDYLTGYLCRPDVSDYECDAKCRYQMTCPIFEVMRDGAKKCAEEAENINTASTISFSTSLALLCLLSAAFY